MSRVGRRRHGGGAALGHGVSIGPTLFSGMPTTWLIS